MKNSKIGRTSNKKRKQNFPVRRINHEIAHAASWGDRVVQEKKSYWPANRPEHFLVFAIIICKLNLPRIWQAGAFLSFIFFFFIGLGWCFPFFPAENKRGKRQLSTLPPLYRVGILCFDSAVTHTQVLDDFEMMWRHPKNDQPDPGITLQRAILDAACCCLIKYRLGLKHHPFLFLIPLFFLVVVESFLRICLFTIKITR